MNSLNHSWLEFPTFNKKLNGVFFSHFLLGFDDFWFRFIYAVYLFLFPNV